MNLNHYASSAKPLDMTRTDEFQSLLQSAADLDIPHCTAVRYESRSVVVRHLRFNVLDWGPLDAPTLSFACTAAINRRTPGIWSASPWRSRIES